MKTTLYDFPIFPISEASEAQKRLQGENQKGILIALDWEGDSENLRPFLSKVLSAVKLDIDKDVLLLFITPEENIGLARLINDHGIDHILLFGPFTHQLGLQFTLRNYQPTRVSGRIFLQVDKLKAIFEERQSGGKKMAGALWNNLKSIFLKS